MVLKDNKRNHETERRDAGHGAETMTDLYWPYPDSPVSCSSVSSSCSSVSEMSVSPAPSPHQPDATETETETDTETVKIKTEVKTEPVQTEAEPVTDSVTESNDNVSPSTTSWSSERLDNAGCGLRGVTGVTVHYPPNPYRRADPYRTPASRSRRRRPPAAVTAAAVSAPDAADQRRFRQAVGAGDSAAVRQMLTEGARVGLNSMDGEGWTALHRAVRSGDLELVRLLVSHGADFRLADRDGFSPLHLASWGGHSQVLLYLLGLQR